MADKKKADQQPEIRCGCGAEFATTEQLDEHAQGSHKE